MSECRNCNVAVPYNSNCPLCGKYLNDGIRAQRFPVANTGRKVGAKKVLRFLFIVTGFITLFLDALITQIQGWSFVPCAVLALVWFFVIEPAFDKKPFARFVLYDVMLLCLLTLMLDLQYTGYSGWSTSYVMPGAVAAGITLILFSSFIRKVKWSEVGVYVLTLALFNLAFVLFGIFRIIPYIELSIIVCAYSLICLFGMRYFLDKVFNEELHRKLHM